MIMESLAKMGFSIPDLIVSFVLSIMILLLIFVFIFIGINAFSPDSSFSSVTNSMMPLGAGGAVGKNKNEEEKPEDLKAVANE
jgi:hypothetical protein